MHTNLLILFTFFLSINFAQAAYSPPAQTEQDFQRWLKSFKKTGLEHKIPTQTIEEAFRNIHLNHKILELDRKQPEFFSTFWQYFERATSPWRISNGKKLYQKHLPQLTQITKEYGIPERILVSFWGLETNYGNFTGNHSIIEALATLSYDKRRRDFFQSELISALKILDKGYVKPSVMKGSWAGAMGQCQFMPSNYLRYAVDGDQDGKKDLWNSLPDVFNSMGNFLQQLGWKRGENWGREVNLPANFNLSLADGKTEYSLKKWRQLGLTLVDGRNLPNVEEPMNAKLILASDYRGPAFLVYHNFFVIKKWNRSNKYALAVGHLADRIVGRNALSKSKPDDDKALSRNQMIEMQTLLTNQGYSLGKADGIAGGKTKKAIREYQKKQKIAADGYPSYRMLKILRANKNVK